MEKSNKKGKIGCIVIVAVVVVFILFVILFRTFIAPIINAKTDAQNSQPSKNSSSMSSSAISSNQSTSSEVSSKVQSVQARVEISGDSVNYSGSVNQELTLSMAFKNVGATPINGFQVMSNDLGGSNFSILSVSDNAKIKKTDLAQYFTWDKVLQPQESYTIQFELQPMKAQSKKARLFLQTLDGMSMLEGQTKDLAFMSVNLSIK